MTTTPITSLVLALLLLIAGALSWAAAGVADDLSTRHERLATFADPQIPARGRWTTALEAVLDPDGSTQSATVGYWRGNYAAAQSEQSSDAEALIVAANAMFRQVQAQAGSGPMSVERLDRTLQAYVAVLKNAGFSRDAAFNYEFVARTRDTLARSKPPRQSPQPPPKPTPDDDLPTGATIHGRPGRHPPNTRGEEFEILTPMDYGEREAQPEPTPGRPLPRKG
jgi:hypothetical protein